MQAPTYASPEALENAVLEAIRELVKRSGVASVGITEIVAILFPSPAYPKTGSPATAFTDWLAVNKVWTGLVYGVQEGVVPTPYAQTFNSQVTQAFIELVRSGALREQPTGLGTSFFYLND
jgi:hypothetical protein